MRCPVAADPVTPGYDALGIEGYYRAHALDYRNPHEPAVRELLAAVAPSLDLARVLDLACGSGEVTLALPTAVSTEAADPYTADAYLARTGRVAEPVDFASIAAGALAGRSWSVIVCSFALHLVEPSRLPVLCRALADLTPTLVVVTPHKRPEIRAGWGWAVPPVQTMRNRVRLRVYASTRLPPWLTPEANGRNGSERAA